MSLITLNAISQVCDKAWDRLFGAQPFLQHRFLNALEQSACVSAESGWQVQHKLFQNAQGELIAAAPGYLKSHSWGEYVFDMAWADASHRAGLAYYPKHLCAVPFSPIQGPRLAGAGAAELLAALTNEAERQGLSGIHINFSDAACDQLLRGQEGWLERLGCQFHWRNPGYRDMQDFLDTFTSRKRKQLRKERESVLAQGFSFLWQAGTELDERDLDLIYACYINTYHVRGRTPYLTRDFFSLLRQVMPETVQVVWVKQAGKACAMALSLMAEGRLYGRYWGSLVEAPHLHFETCLYQGIEKAITERWHYFDAGAQGEHKLIRGFEPVLTRSWHWLNHPGLRQAVAQFLAQERVAVRQYAEQARTLLPYRATLTDV